MRPVPVLVVPVSLLHSSDRNYRLLWYHMHMSIRLLPELPAVSVSAVVLEPPAAVLPAEPAVAVP